jgi:subtilase family serine protease
LKRFLSTLSAVAVLLATLSSAQAQPLAADSPDGGTAHPTFHVRNRPASSAPSGYTPTQMRHAYGFDQIASDGTGQIVAVVDAYDDPTIASDLQTFINTYGLRTMNGLPGTPSCTVTNGPHPCFQKMTSPPKPRKDSGWALEISLDVEWSHAIAPGADILLVEASNNLNSSLLKAVDTAVGQGAHVVSMSWGSNDYSTESSNDSHFNHSGVTFTASSGDSGGGVIYPAVSPDVVAVGGTTLNLDGLGNVTSETAWSGSGGGISAYETEPGYQSSYPIPSTSGKRGNPDVAYNADPNTGVGVYDTTPYNGQSGWFQVGGTSAGAPQWAALVALVDQTRTSGSLSSNNLSSSPEYNAAATSVYATNYRDVTSGSNGTCSICSATPGYDFVTGLGGPLANSLVPYLASH